MTNKIQAEAAKANLENTEQQSQLSYEDYTQQIDQLLDHKRQVEKYKKDNEELYELFKSESFNKLFIKQFVENKTVEYAAALGNPSLSNEGGREAIAQFLQGLNSVKFLVNQLITTYEQTTETVELLDKAIADKAEQANKLL